MRDSAHLSSREKCTVVEFVFGFILSALIVGLMATLFLRYRADPEASRSVQPQIESARKEMSLQLSQTLTHINEQLTRHSLLFAQQLGQFGEQIQLASGQMGARLDHANQMVGDVQQNLGALSLATEKVYEVGKNIASLQELLKAPKLRGALGEFLLGELLGQILPASSFTLQYMFKSGEIVDALIHLGQGGVPVDSKFPLENFRRMTDASVTEDEKKGFRKKFNQDIKKHVDQIASKYILPDERTFEFAFMYIPAENVYYEMIIKEEGNEDEKSLSAYALSKKVVPVSPNSLYTYLQAILLGLKGVHFEKSSREISDHLSRLRIDFMKFREDFEILGKHLNSAKVKYEESMRKSDRFQDKLNEFEMPLDRLPFSENRTGPIPGSK